MPSHQRLDKAILAVVQARQPISLNNIMTHIDSDHVRDGRSMRTAKERVYALRRAGELQQVGIGQNTTYALPDFDSATTEAQRQACEARERAGDPSPIAPVVVVVEDNDLPVGWRTLREQQLDWERDDQPLTTTVPPLAQRPRLSMDISALAGDVAAAVAMTVERVVGLDIKRYEAVIEDLQSQLTQQNVETARLREELTAAEQLGAEAESKYNELREKLRSL